jgi:hypothetical protein
VDDVLNPYAPGAGTPPPELAGREPGEQPRRPAPEQLRPPSPPGQAHADLVGPALGARGGFYLHCGLDRIASL